MLTQSYYVHESQCPQEMEILNIPKLTILEKTEKSQKNRIINSSRIFSHQHN